MCLPAHSCCTSCSMCHRVWNSENSTHESQAKRCFVAHLPNIPSTFHPMILSLSKKPSINTSSARNPPSLPADNQSFQINSNSPDANLPLPTPPLATPHNHLPGSCLLTSKSSILVPRPRPLPPIPLAQRRNLHPTAQHALRITSACKPPLPTKRQLYTVRSGDEELSGQEIRTGRVLHDCCCAFEGLFCGAC